MHAVGFFYNSVCSDGLLNSKNTTVQISLTTKYNCFESSHIAIKVAHAIYRGTITFDRCKLNNL